MGKFSYLLLLSIALALPAQGAVITNLGVLGNDKYSGATDINDAGVVVGVSFYNPFEPIGVAYEFHGFRWTAGTGVQSVGGSGADSMSYANGINASGKIVGWSYSTLGNAGKSYLPLGPVQQIANAGEATEINDNGVMVGFVPQAGVTQHAYRYDGVNAPQDLGVIGGTKSYAHDINNSGTVVGWSNINSSSVKKAFRYVGNGTMQAIPGLSNFSDSEAHAINNAGDIVGSNDGQGGAFRYTSGGTLIPLPGLPKVAWDINDAGFVVGTAGIDGRAALWRPNNTFINLDAWLDTNFPAEGAKWILDNGVGINSNGLIVGRGRYDDGVGGLSDGQRTFVLDASSLIPEPSSAMLLSLSLLIARRRR